VALERAAVDGEGERGCCGACGGLAMREFGVDSSNLVAGPPSGASFVEFAGRTADCELQHGCYSSSSRWTCLTHTVACAVVRVLRIGGAFLDAQLGQASSMALRMRHLFDFLDMGRGLACEDCASGGLDIVEAAQHVDRLGRAPASVFAGKSLLLRLMRAEKSVRPGEAVKAIGCGQFASGAGGRHGFEAGADDGYCRRLRGEGPAGGFCECVRSLRV